MPTQGEETQGSRTQGLETDETQGAGEGSSATVDHPREKPGLASLDRIDPTRYDVQREHGRGGFGRVLVAEDVRIGRQGALKEPLSRSEAEERRFVDEALLTARLQHPAIVPVYEVARRPTGEPFFTMKFVAGRSLRELVGEAKTRDARLALLPHVIA